MMRITPTPGRRSRALVALLLLSGSVVADEPWRIDDARAAPDWLILSGSYRLRYEWLDNPYRAGGTGSNDILVSRLLLSAEAALPGGFRLAGELQDARAWDADGNAPLTTGEVNALEPLQVYLGYRAADVVASGDSLDLRVGRITMAMGSNRLLARHIYRNTQQGFSGVEATWSSAGGPRLQLFATRPVTRLPNDRPGLDDNDVEWDEDAATVFWGVHLDRLSIAGVDASIYLVGIDESDSERRPTRNRNYLTAGTRLLDDAGPWTWEIELMLQEGSVRASPLAADTSNLDHRAWLLHAEFGRRFSGAWDPAVELRYDYASGDESPVDGDNERFDGLFGPQRFDFGPAGIYNAIRRTNVSTIGLYADLAPVTGITWMTGYRAAWLASDTDSFAASGVRDPTGASGSFVGHQVETRVRWELEPGNLRLEFGGAVLFKGEFLEDAPNAPDTGDTAVLYSTILVSF